MNINNKKDLVSMGYREAMPGCWLKPIGWQCFFFKESTSEFLSYFKDAQGNLACWDSKKIVNHEDFLHELKSFEAYSRTDICINFDSNFEYFSQEESLIIDAGL